VRFYSTLAAKLVSESDIKVAAARILRCLEKEQEWSAANALLASYRPLGLRIEDPAHIGVTLEAIRQRLDEPRNDGAFTIGLAAAYCAVTSVRVEKADAKKEAAALRQLITAVAMRGELGGWSHAYACIVRHLTSPADLLIEATSVLTQLEQARDQVAAETLSLTYTELVARLGNGAHLEKDVARLRARLELERDPFLARHLLAAYSAAVIRLHDTPTLKAEAGVLRDRVEREHDAGLVNEFATAYASIIQSLMSALSTDHQAAVIEDILTVASHPLLESPEPLVSIVQSLANKPFEGRIGNAARWALDNRNILPQRLRPAPARLVAH
jgi:hypothetical protein